MIMASIDMGLRGAITFWRVNNKNIGRIIEVYRFSTTKNAIIGKRDIDYQGLKKKLFSFSPTLIVYERQFVGRNQAFSREIYGREGIIVGLCLAITPNVFSITPKEWTDLLSVTSDKQQHILLANKYYPMVQCTHDGEADSILIGHAYLKKMRLDKIYKVT